MVGSKGAGFPYLDWWFEFWVASRTVVLLFVVSLEFVVPGGGYCFGYLMICCRLLS